MATATAKRDWSQPTDISDATLAFPANVRQLMPAYDDIPKEFRNGRRGSQKWIRFQQDWFFSGMKKSQLIRKQGVDAERAFRHLSAIQGSFEPKHEHKEAAVAYLASLWFDDVHFQS